MSGRTTPSPPAGANALEPALGARAVFVRPVVPVALGGEVVPLGIVLCDPLAARRPVVMLEGASPRAALRRSRELVRGHGTAVFVVLPNVGLRVGFAGIAFALAVPAAGGSLLVAWLLGGLGSALPAPFAARAMTVVYSRITDPTRPLVVEPRRGWASVWDEEDEAA